MSCRQTHQRERARRSIAGEFGPQFALDELAVGVARQLFGPEPDGGRDLELGDPLGEFVVAERLYEFDERANFVGWGRVGSFGRPREGQGGGSCGTGEKGPT